MNASFSTRTGACRRFTARRLAMAAVVACGVVGSATAFGNGITMGRVFGSAPAGATVLVSSPDIGIQRSIKADDQGMYRLSSVPVGIYKVTVVDAGQPLVMHPDVRVFADTGSRVDFSCPYGRCAEVAAN